jgi:foldase protein PrsA
MRLNMLALFLLMGSVAASAVMAAPAVTVNGVPITTEEYVSAMETTPISTPQGTKLAGVAALERLVSDAIFVQLAEKEGVPVTDAQIEQRIKAAEKDGSGADALTGRRLSVSEFKRELRGKQAFVNLANKLTVVTDGAVEDYYFKNQDKYKQPAKVRIGVIMAKVRSKIDRAASKLKGGTDFGAVAKELSEDAVSKDSGGVLGWVWPNEPGVPPAIWNTAMGLKTGAVSGPVKVQDDWVIIKAFERKGPVSIPMEDAKDTIREGIAVERALKNADLQKKVQDAQRSAVIQVSIDRFKDFGAELKGRTAPGQ